MKTLLTTLYLTLAVLLESTGMSEGADFQKGIDAYNKEGYATALCEWTPLVKQGNAAAQSNLGLMYAEGLGVIQDDVYAHMWWNIAASSGDEYAIGNRDIVQNR